MGPYTKTQTAVAIDDGWDITDGDGRVIAILETEGLADLVLARLRGETPMSLTAGLKDRAEGAENQIVVRVLNDNGSSLTIAAEDHGDSHGDSHSYVISLEVWQGELRLLVWTEIDDSEPTHIVNLAGARQSNRRW